MNDSTLALAPVKSPFAEDEDRELAASFARDEPQALERLIERYQPRIAGLAARLLGWSAGVDDVTQEVFLAALRHRSRFRGESRLWTYLATITVNHCRSLRRRQWIEQRVLRAVWFGRAESQPSQQQGAERDETAAAVRTAIARLPGKYREVVVLRYLEELSITEVAELLRLERNTVEVRLSRARAMLSGELKHLAAM